MSRQIIAHYDDQGIVVYQAFRPSIVEAALAKGTYGAGFNVDRMTWIKPSLGWMLHRSSYATAHRQERILAIKVPHDFFARVLSAAVLTSYERDVYPSKQAWRDALRDSPVRCQWDPDRDWAENKLERRAIQLGHAGPLVHEYVAAVISVADATPLAHECLRQREARRQPPPSDYPIEREYPVSPAIAARLCIGVT